jgi:uncharacterized protein (DUF952 family)
MTNSFIYHIVTVNQWNVQKNNPYYSTASIAIEGFIHCSTQEQFIATIERYYANEKEVVVLTIDVSKVEPKIEYELAPSVNQMFPHIFGELNLSAIVEVKIISVVDKNKSSL